MKNRPLQDLVRDQSPVTMDMRSSVREACRKMGDRRVGCVLVTDRGKLAGIFTGRDAVRLLADDAADGNKTLGRAMTRNPHTLGPNAKAMDALRCMQDGGFRHVPIVDGDKLVGVVSRGDFRAIEHARLDEETGYWERIW